jgi:hypothetical protein
MLLVPLITEQFGSEVKVILRPTVSMPVCRGIGHPSGAHDEMFTTAGHLLFSYCMAPSLKRGLVSNLLVKLGLRPVSAVSLRSDFRGTSAHISMSHLRLPQTWWASSPYLYPPGTGWTSYTPGHWVPFSSPLTTRRATRLHTVLAVRMGVS